jgi:cellulose synthase (UDP-forming)
LPRLELVVDAGYPFTEWADLSGTAVVLSNAPTPGEYQSLLNMVGFFGAQTGAPVTGLTVTTPENVRSAQDKDLVVLGSPASQPLLAVWASRMPATMSSGTLAVNPAPTPSRWLYPHWPFRDDDRQRLARALTGDPRPDAIVEHFVSPFRPDRSVVAIVPGDADTWQTAESLFVQRLGPVYGGVAIAREGRFESFLLGVTAYHAGSVNRYQRLHVYLVEYYSLIPVVVLLVALVIGGGLHTGAERVAQRRLEHL